MSASLLRLAGGLLLAYGLICVLVFLAQRRLLYFPDPLPLQRGGEIGAQTLTLRPADGERLQAWWLPPPKPDAPVLLYLHGNGANLDNRADRFRLLHEDGYGVLALSWRGYGGSTGSPSEAGWRLDARAGYDWLRAQGIAAQRLVLFGESLGSPHAVMLAAEQPVAALLLDSSFDSALALARGHYPWLPVRWLMRDPHRADLAAPRIQVPVLQLHCSGDAIAPLARAQALQARLGRRSQLQVLEGDCHVPSYLTFRAPLRAFLAGLPH